MGIGSNLMVEIQEEEIAEQNYSNIIYEATHYVVNEKISRKNAFELAKSKNEQRQDSDNFIVIDEDSGEVEYLHSELIEPQFTKTKQIKKVAEELYSQFE